MEIDLSKINNIHFIGIGGIGISAIARMMMNDGKKVTGQDMQDGQIVKELKKLGAEIIIGQSFENIPEDTELIVYTIAIDNYDEELSGKIKNQNKIPTRSYPQMLGLLSKDKYTIAISGTHGKTTTTGMLAQVLVDAEKDPTVVVGSLLKGGSNFIGGKSDLFLVEACEYRRSFLNVNPKILVITNIDEDHLDYYKDIEDIKSAFRELALKVPSDGFVVCNPNDKNVGDVIKDIKAKIVNWEDYFNPDLKLKIPGIHNKKDAGASVAVATLLGIKKEKAEESLMEFPGTWRRFEYKGEIMGGAKLYDDYAHHPVEIASTLEGFRELYPKADGWKVTVVFQPHLFSRTKLLLKDFGESFGEADMVLLLPIYMAREKDDGTISSQILANEINTHQENAKAFLDFETASIYLKKYLEVELPNIEKNLVVTMGAGEAFKIGDNLTKE